MIKRKKGLINEIIYNETVYNNNQNRFYPAILELNHLIDKIIEAKATTEYVRIIPFYINSKLNGQVEFDEYMFFIMCQDDFTEVEFKEHLTSCMDHIYDIPHDVEQYDDMSEEKKRDARIRYPICKNGDYETYIQYLLRYKEYLNELIPILFDKVVKKLNLSQDDMAFGYFCFEVHSG